MPRHDTWSAQARGGGRSRPARLWRRSGAGRARRVRGIEWCWKDVAGESFASGWVSAADRAAGRRREGPPKGLDRRILADARVPMRGSSPISLDNPHGVRRLGGGREGAGAAGRTPRIRGESERLRRTPTQRAPRFPRPGGAAVAERAQPTPQCPGERWPRPGAVTVRSRARASTGRPRFRARAHRSARHLVLPPGDLARAEENTRGAVVARRALSRAREAATAARAESVIGGELEEAQRSARPRADRGAGSRRRTSR
jgi:hypothetical protein